MLYGRSMQHPLRKWLDRKGLTQQAFAASIGLDGASLSRILNGQTGPSLETAFAIEDATRKAVRARELILREDGRRQ